MKEIEADGFITQANDITDIKKTCYNCKRYQYTLQTKSYRCTEGHLIDEPDWRQKYNVCDRWQKI